MRISRRQIVVYPFFFAIYPLLNLYITNVHLVELSAVVKPLLLILGATLFLYLVVNRILKASTSAGIFTATIAVAVLYYGAFYDVVGKMGAIGSTVQRHEYLLPLWVIFFVLVGTLAVRKRVASAQVNAYLNFLSAAIIGVVLVPAVVSLVRGATSDLSPAQAASSSPQSPTRGRSLNARIELDALPDVYYIILDGYGRADVLLDYYDFNNSAFIDSLTSKGFYVVSESRSNYPHTFMSLASSLNMDYLDVSLTDGLSRSERIGAILPLLENNYVIREFNNRGYTTIHFASGWEATDYNELADINFKFSFINQFKSLFLNTTILRPIAPDYSQNELRMVVLYTFNKMKDIAKIKGPTFTFAHVYPPHPPFIFDREGNFPGYEKEAPPAENGWLPKERYTDQVYFVNQLVEDLVDSILAQSEDPTIIIIQADHGPDSSWMRSRERLAILNAYYLPQGGEEYLYPTITPVNTFRLIFDLYFHTDFGLLEDETLFSLSDYPFNFCKVDDIYAGTSDQDLWAARMTQSLAEHAYRLRANDCAFEQILLINDGFSGLEWGGDRFFRWARPSLNLQLPIEANQDYIFRAGVRHALPGESQEVRLLIDGELVGSTTVPQGADEEITFIVPAEQIHTESFVRVRVEHSYSIAGLNGDPRKLSLRYHWIEWAPLSQAEILFNPNAEDIVAGDGIFLGGGGWYTLEFGDENFRWVNNDAEIVVIAPGDSPEISLGIAPGPGLSYQPFELQVLDENGQAVATAEVKGRETVEVALPLVAGEGQVFRLHVEGGGQQAAPNDPRTLNFRVFRLGW